MDSVPVFRDVCVCVCVCVCVFSGRQVSLDLVLRWTSKSVCVCSCAHEQKWVFLCSVATRGKF